VLSRINGNLPIVVYGIVLLMILAATVVLALEHDISGTAATGPLGAVLTLTGYELRQFAASRSSESNDTNAKAVHVNAIDPVVAPPPVTPPPPKGATT
jgi:hypothetical protein